MRRGVSWNVLRVPNTPCEHVEVDDASTVSLGGKICHPETAYGIT